MAGPGTTRQLKVGHRTTDNLKPSLPNYWNGSCDNWNWVLTDAMVTLGTLM